MMQIVSFIKQMRSAMDILVSSNLEKDWFGLCLMVMEKSSSIYG